MENLKPPFGLEFGMDRHSVIEIMKKQRESYYYESKSDYNNLLFHDIKLAGRECKVTLRLIDGKLCRVEISITQYGHFTKDIELYNQIKSELNAKYYITENDFIEYHPPAYFDDNFEETHEQNIKRRLIEYTAFWNFSSNGDYDDYIFIKITNEFTIKIIYEHGDLNRKFIEKQKSEW